MEVVNGEPWREGYAPGVAGFGLTPANSIDFHDYWSQTGPYQSNRLIRDWGIRANNSAACQHSKTLGVETEGVEQRISTIKMCCPRGARMAGG